MKELAVSNVKQDEEKIKQLKTIIKSGNPGGVYFFYGEEAYLKDYYIKALRDACGKGFDSVKLTARDFTPARLSDEIISYPLTDTFKYIEINDAELNKLKGSDRNNFLDILSDIPGYTCVVFNYSGSLTSEKREKGHIFSDIMELSFTVEFTRQSAAKLEKWLNGIFVSEGISCESGALLYLLNRSSGDMYGLYNEAYKLAAYINYHGGENPRLTRSDIDELVPENIEIEAFGMANSVLEGNYIAALDVLNKMKIRAEDPHYILSSVSAVFCDLLTVYLGSVHFSRDNRVLSKEIKMHEYKVKLYLSALNKQRSPQAFLTNALSRCAECDAAVKSSGGDIFILLEGLIYSLWNAKQ